MKSKNLKNKTSKVGKNDKMIISCVLIAILILLVVYLILNNSVFSAENFAKKYAEAVVTGDKIKEYKYAGVTNKNEFVSEKEIEETYKDKVLRKVDSLEIVGEKEAKKIKNVELPSVSKNEKLFVAKYKLKNNKTTRYLVVTLKRTNNRYLIFKNWKVTNQDYFSDNVIVKIPTNTKAYLNNKKLTDNYKMDSNDTNSISYEIPNLAKNSVLLQLELKNGIKIEKTINPSSDKVVDATDFSGYKLSSSSSSALEKVINNFSDLYVSGALSGKSINTISKNSIWTKELVAKDEFKNNYQTLVDKYKTKKVSNYKIKNIDTSSSYIYSFDTIKINANVEYSYKLSKKKKDKSTTIDIEVKNDDKLYINGFSIYGLQYMF